MVSGKHKGDGALEALSEGRHFKYKPKNFDILKKIQLAKVPPLQKWQNASMPT